MRQSWQMWSGVVDNDVIDKIINAAHETRAASTFNAGGDTIRSSKVSWLSNQNWLLNMLHDFVDMANRNAFNVHVYKKAEIQFTEYYGTERGHYSWHHDIDWNRNDGLDRKLSITLQLSDPTEYEGGRFSFSETSGPDADKLAAKGTILVFPSYLQHCVEPVTSGVRKSLVAWFEGPKWK